MSSTRITLTFRGQLAATTTPTGSESVLTFSAESALAAGAWQAGGQDSIETASWVTLPWRSGLVAEVIGIQVRSGAPLNVRITREVSAQAVIAADPLCLLSFPLLDRVTLLEVSGSASEASEFEWLAVGIAAE